VRNVFTLSGNHVMSVFDAAIGHDLGLVHVRHEAAAVHMADAWGRITGTPGVALLTGGPGHANGVPALYTAQFSESPVVMLSGHAPLDQMGDGAFQELRQAELAAPVAKASWVVKRAADLGHDVALALAIARTGRPGPVHLSLPSDQLESTIADFDAARPAPSAFAVSERALAPADAAAFVAAVRAAKRPLMLVAPFTNRGAARAAIERMAAALDLPWASMESPRGMSEPSLGALADVLPEADLVVLFGKRIDFTLRFGAAPAIAADARFVQIDPEDDAIARTRRLVAADRVAFTAVADLLGAARAIVAAAGDTPVAPRDWTAAATAAIRHRPNAWSTLGSRGPGAVHPIDVCRALETAMSGRRETVLVADGGEYAQWAQGTLSATHRITNGPAGAIGAAPPFAAAAKLACPDALVVACMGDGSFGFHLAELDTAVRHRLPYVAVVGNDATWNAEQQIQRREYGPDRLIGCDLLPTRYDLAVQGLGGHGELVTERADLGPAIERAIASGRPACVNVMIEKHPAPSIRRGS
jgi:acetolactate synthase-1/2/3 large subunit